LPNRITTDYARDNRFAPEQSQQYRTPAQVDRDRILYSTPFARLAEVTQVVAAERGHVFHNRLTHSIKVGQLARRIAEKLLHEQSKEAESMGGLDPDVAEAAGLAHDLGHPPFGHIAEETLNHLSGDSGGFEGNAQSFRIVTKLAISDAMSETAPVEGLNLTRATLNAILKYPWLRAQNPAKQEKWGAYDSEQEIFDWVRTNQPFGSLVKSIEAEIMDWADDITFAVHDLVDFFRAGQIPLERLGDDGGTMEQGSFFEEVFTRCPELHARRPEFEDAFKSIVTMFSVGKRYVGTTEQRRHLWQLGTVLISRFVEAIRLDPDGPRAVYIQEYAKDEIRVLKELTWHYVILHHELATGQHGQKTIVGGLFKTLVEAAAGKSHWKLFPASVQEQLGHVGTDRPSLVRVVIDHISSMTEKEAVRQYRVLNGAD